MNLHLRQSNLHRSAQPPRKPMRKIKRPDDTVPITKKREPLKPDPARPAPQKPAPQKPAAQKPGK